MSDTITINGVDYVRADTVTPAPPEGEANRHVLVVDRGWIFAGDLEDRDGRVILTRAVWLFRFERIGFAAAIENPKREEVDVRPWPNGVNIPAGAEVFRVPVPDAWGL